MKAVAYSRACSSFPRSAVFSLFFPEHLTSPKPRIHLWMCINACLYLQFISV